MPKQDDMVKVAIVDLKTGVQTEKIWLRAPRPDEVTIWDLDLNFTTNRISIRVDWPLEKGK